MDRLIVGIFVFLFFLGCAYAGWIAGTTLPWWALLLFFSLYALVMLDRRR